MNSVRTNLKQLGVKISQHPRFFPTVALMSTYKFVWALSAMTGQCSIDLARDGNIQHNSTDRHQLVYITNAGLMLENNNLAGTLCI